MGSKLHVVGINGLIRHISRLEEMEEAAEEERKF